MQKIKKYQKVISGFVLFVFFWDLNIFYSITPIEFINKNYLATPSLFQSSSESPPRSFALGDSTLIKINDEKYLYYNQSFGGKILEIRKDSRDFYIIFNRKKYEYFLPDDYDGDVFGFLSENTIYYKNDKLRYFKHQNVDSEPPNKRPHTSDDIGDPVVLSQTESVSKKRPREFESGESQQRPLKRKIHYILILPIDIKRFRKDLSKAIKTCDVECVRDLLELDIATAENLNKAFQDLKDDGTIDQATQPPGEIRVCVDFLYIAASLKDEEKAIEIIKMLISKGMRVVVGKSYKPILRECKWLYNKWEGKDTIEQIGADVLYFPLFTGRFLKELKDLCNVNPKVKEFIQSMIEWKAFDRDGAIIFKKTNIGNLEMFFFYISNLDIRKIEWMLEHGMTTDVFFERRSVYEKKIPLRFGAEETFKDIISAYDRKKIDVFKILLCQQDFEISDLPENLLKKFSRNCSWRRYASDIPELLFSLWLYVSLKNYAIVDQNQDIRDIRSILLEKGIRALENEHVKALISKKFDFGMLGPSGMTLFNNPYAKYDIWEFDSAGVGSSYSVNVLDLYDGYTLLSTCFSLDMIYGSKSLSKRVVIPANRIHRLLESRYVNQELRASIGFVISKKQGERVFCNHFLMDEGCIVEKDKFSSLGLDVERLWRNLIENAYIDEQGKILDKFKALRDSSEMELDPSFVDEREDIFKILYPLYVFTPDKSRHSTLHTERQFVNYLTRQYYDNLIQFLSVKFGDHSERKKVYAVVIDLYSTHDVCNDCKGGLIGLWDKLSELKKKMVDRGFEVNDLRIVIRVTSFKRFWESKVEYFANERMVCDCYKPNLGFLGYLDVKKIHEARRILGMPIDLFSMDDRLGFTFGGPRFLMTSLGISQKVLKMIYDKVTTHNREKRIFCIQYKEDFKYLFKMGEIIFFKGKIESFTPNPNKYILVRISIFVVLLLDCLYKIHPEDISKGVLNLLFSVDCFNHYNHLMYDDPYVYEFSPELLEKLNFLGVKSIFSSI